ncbi:hypothetical protein NS277_08485 [Novosphingobium barchaimii]|nr:hypothetical protein NS277_08485 [Novosphingobium barchaimii]
MFQQMDLFAKVAVVPVPRSAPAAPPSQAVAIERIAAHSRRPRYAFMVLHLIAEIARSDGSAGPYVDTPGERVSIRDWLCDALLPLAHRDQRRQAVIAKVREQLKSDGKLPEDAAAADATIEQATRDHVRKSGRCNVSTAVSDLVRAGLLRRHYQGFRVDHHNRGAQREAVYTLTAEASAILQGRGGLPA